MDAEPDFDARLAEMRRVGPRMKALARRAGCRLPFYDYLDSYADQYKSLLRWAGKTCPSLVGVAEVPFADIYDVEDWPALGVPADCRLLAFTDPDEATQTQYGTRPGGDAVGITLAFQDPAGRLRTLILAQADPAPGQSRGEFEMIRLAILLHEIGHVRDHEAGRHFDHASGGVDWVGAEVSANLFALAECDRRGYLVTAECFRSSLRPWLAEAGIRRTVAERVFAAPVAVSRPWPDYLPERQP